MAHVRRQTLCLPMPLGFSRLGGKNREQATCIQPVSQSGAHVGDGAAALVVALDVNDIVRLILEGVVVADDKDLAEALYLHDLFGKRLAPVNVQMRGWLVEECQIDLAQFAQERKSH